VADGSSEKFTRQSLLIFWFNSLFLELCERHGGLKRRFKAFVNTLVISATATSFVALAAEKVAHVRRAAHQFACASLFEPFRDGFLSFLHKKGARLKRF